MRILHVFRSPVGGLFRHVCDVAQGQTDAGHTVGIVCDSMTGGDGARLALSKIAEKLSGGVHTLEISRGPSLSDFNSLRIVTKMVREGGYDIIHGHGAKGGLLARLAGWRSGVPSVYSPHGGSLHFSWRKPSGAAFLLAEKVLSHFGSGLLFVCAFERDAFERRIGTAGKPVQIVHNALWPAEFAPVARAANATDLLFVGEIRHLKGIDVLLSALRAPSCNQLTLTIVGDGPEQALYEAEVKRLNLGSRVRFMGRLPIGQALPLGRMMVVPSRNESFPYVVLEAIASHTPTLATAVGGIPEILPADLLCPPDDVEALARLISSHIADPDLGRRTTQLADRLRDTSNARQMAERITAFYGNLLTA